MKTQATTRISTNALLGRAAKLIASLVAATEVRRQIVIAKAQRNYDRLSWWWPFCWWLPTGKLPEWSLNLHLEDKYSYVHQDDYKISHLDELRRLAHASGDGYVTITCEDATVLGYEADARVDDPLLRAMIESTHNPFRKRPSED